MHRRSHSKPNAKPGAKPMSTPRTAEDALAEWLEACRAGGYPPTQDLITQRGSSSTAPITKEEESEQDE